MRQTQIKVWKCTKNASPNVVRVLREGRKGGGTDFYITSDFNVDLGLMCTDENDEEELTKMYVWSLVLARVRQGSRRLRTNHVVRNYERI